MLVVFLCVVFLYLISHRYFWKVDPIAKEKGPGFEMVSHRGVTVNSPENTIESYLEAVDRGFRWIELDVLCTKDRALVCSHNYAVPPCPHQRSALHTLHQVLLARLVVSTDR